MKNVAQSGSVAFSKFSVNWLVDRLELSRGAAAANIRSMEGLRGFAVFLVFLVHYASLVQPWIGHDSVTWIIANAVHSVGNIGVDLFFVLSGYLIYGSLISRKQSFKQFFFKRIKRIYPVFTVIFCIYVFLSIVFPKENKIPLDFFDAGIYLFQNFLLFPGILPVEPMITVAWSLSYEMFYYILTPVLLDVFSLRSRSRIGRVSFFIGISVLTVIACAVYGGPIRLSMFIAGILLYEAMASHRVHAPGDGVAVLALAAAMLVTLLPAGSRLQFGVATSLLFLSFFVLCFTCFADHNSWLARIFSWAPLRWLGNMSYSYYLMHGLTLKAGFLALSMAVKPGGQESAWFWLLLPTMFCFTVVPSLLLFLLVERPFSLVPSHAHEKKCSMNDVVPAKH